MTMEAVHKEKDSPALLVTGAAADSAVAVNSAEADVSAMSAASAHGGGREGASHSQSEGRGRRGTALSPALSLRARACPCVDLACMHVYVDLRLEWTAACVDLACMRVWSSAASEGTQRLPWARAAGQQPQRRWTPYPGYASETPSPCRCAAQSDQYRGQRRPTPEP